MIPKLQKMENLTGDPTETALVDVGFKLGYDKQILAKSKKSRTSI